MKTSFLVIVLNFSFAFLAVSQTWPKIYQGTSSNTSSVCAVETYDHGFAILSDIKGYTYPVLNGWLIKTDINGNILWERNLGNTNNYFSSSKSMKATSDSGIIISMNTGYLETNPFGVTRNAVFIKLNPCGQIDWCKLFDTPEVHSDAGSFIKSSDGYIGLMKVGNHSNTVIKFNFNGQIQWMFEYDHPILETEVFNDIIELADSSLLISGYGIYGLSQQQTHTKPLKLNINPNGDIINFHILYYDNDTIGDATDNQTIESPSGMLFSAGSACLSNQSFRKHSLDEINPTNYCFGVMAETHSLCWLENNTIAITGSRQSFGTGTGIFDISVLDTNGNMLINRELTNYTNNSCQLLLSKTFENKILATGATHSTIFNSSSNTFLYKLTSTLEDDVYDSTLRVYDYACPGGLEPNGTIGMEECDIVVSAAHLATLPDVAVMEVYPNPVSDVFQVRLPEFIAFRNNNKGLNTALYQSNYQQQSVLQVFDLSGRFITEQKLTHGQLIAQFDASRWVPGMYLLRLVYKDKTVGSAKVVK
jgi:hypothetical protein